VPASWPLRIRSRCSPLGFTAAARQRPRRSVGPAGLRRHLPGFRESGNDQAALPFAFATPSSESESECARRHVEAAVQRRGPCRARVYSHPDPDSDHEPARLPASDTPFRRCFSFERGCTTRTRASVKQTAHAR
jgi:hypothetical protein